MISFGAILMLLSVLVILLLLKYKQNVLINTQNIAILNTTHQQNLLQTQIEIQEQTFVHIAREIHDNVGQKLALLKLQLINMPETETINAIHTLTNAIKDLSNLSRTMSTEAVLANGLAVALQTEIDQIKNIALLEISLNIEGEMVFLDGKIELIIFRIVQEALQNIIKHAKASIVKVRLIFSEKTLEIHVEDNGIGIQEQVEHKQKGQGLSNMKARTELLLGNILFKNNMPNGTIIAIKIPIHEQHSF